MTFCFFKIKTSLRRKVTNLSDPNPNPKSHCYLCCTLYTCSAGFISCITMSQAKKRKSAPTLYDHNKRSNPVRNFTRIRGSNSLIIKSAHVTTESAQTSSSSAHHFDDYDPNAAQPDMTYQDGYVLANPDSSESVGIAVKTKPRYQNTVQLLDLLPALFADDPFLLAGRSAEDLGGRIPHYITG